MDAAQLAQDHWNETPLFLTEQERYSMYPWLYEVAEFKKHAGEKVLEIGCGTTSLQAIRVPSALVRLVSGSERPEASGKY
jgi:hypothetical protein